MPLETAQPTTQQQMFGGFTTTPPHDAIKLAQENFEQFNEIYSTWRKTVFNDWLSTLRKYKERVNSTFLSP